MKIKIKISSKLIMKRLSLRVKKKNNKTYNNKSYFVLNAMKLM